MASLEAARDLVTNLLRELDPDARLVEFEENVNGRQCALRINTPDDVGKALVLPKLAVRTALRRESFRRSLRNMLQSALEVHRTRRNLDEAREAVVGASRLPPCPRCLGPIAPRAATFEHGKIFRA